MLKSDKTFILKAQQVEQLNNILDNHKIDKDIFLDYNLHKLTTRINVVDQNGLKYLILKQIVEGKLAAVIAENTDVYLFQDFYGVLRDKEANEDEFEISMNELPKKHLKADVMGNIYSKICNTDHHIFFLHKDRILSLFEVEEAIERVKANPAVMKFFEGITLKAMWSLEFLPHDFARPVDERLSFETKLLYYISAVSNIGDSNQRLYPAFFVEFINRLIDDCIDWSNYEDYFYSSTFFYQDIDIDSITEKEIDMKILMAESFIQSSGELTNKNHSN
jgi:hypothetical protein